MSALPASGAISLNDIHIEAGGTSGTQVSLNDADIRRFRNLSSGATNDMDNFHNQRKLVMTVGINSPYRGFSTVSGDEAGSFADDYRVGPWGQNITNFYYYTVTPRYEIRTGGGYNMNDGSFTDILIYNSSHTVLLANADFSSKGTTQWTYNLASSADNVFDTVGEVFEIYFFK